MLEPIPKEIRSEPIVDAEPLEAVEEGLVLGRSKASRDFWAGVKKENEAYGAGPIIGHDISEGVDVILSELGISKPEIPQEEAPAEPRRARSHKKTLSLDM